MLVMVKRVTPVVPYGATTEMDFNSNLRMRRQGIPPVAFTSLNNIGRVFQDTLFSVYTVIE